MGVYCDNSAPGTIGTVDTMATPASEDRPTKEGGGLLCPIGGKTAKRKRKGKVRTQH